MAFYPNVNGYILFAKFLLLIERNLKIFSIYKHVLNINLVWFCIRKEIGLFTYGFKYIRDMNMLQ